MGTLIKLYGVLKIVLKSVFQNSFAVYFRIKKEKVKLVEIKIFTYSYMIKIKRIYTQAFACSVFESSQLVTVHKENMNKIGHPISIQKWVLGQKFGDCELDGLVHVDIWPPV